MAVDIDEIKAASVRGRTRPERAIELALSLRPGERESGRLALVGAFPSATITSTIREEFAVRIGSVTQIAISNPAHCIALSSLILVDEPALERIEAGRQPGAGVVIELTLNPSVCESSSARAAEEGMFSVSAMGQPHVYRDVKTTVAMPSEDWRRILREIRFSDVVVFESRDRFVSEMPTPTIVAAIGQLAKARFAFDDGRWDEVPGPTYTALNSLVPNEDRIATAIIARYFGNEPAQVSERIEKAIISILSTHQFGRHALGDAREPNVPVSRDLAKWMLGTAQIIVGWCAANERRRPAP